VPGVEVWPKAGAGVDPPPRVAGDPKAGAAEEAGVAPAAPLPNMLLPNPEGDPKEGVMAAAVPKGVAAGLPKLGEPKVGVGEPKPPPAGGVTLYF